MATPMFPASPASILHHGVLLSQDLDTVLHTSSTPLLKSSDPVLTEFANQEKVTRVGNEANLQRFDQLKQHIGYLNALRKLETERTPSGNDCNIVICSTICKVLEQTIESTPSPEGQSAVLACDLEISSETKQLVDPQTFSDTLHMFGSHVFAGNKKLGGAFELTFFHSEQVDMQEMSELWKLIWKGFSESDGLFGSSGSGEEYSVQQLVQLGLLNSEFSESRKITKVRATTIGGARGRCTYNTWYQALENQDNCDFAIIEGKLLPIWTIIDNNINFL